MKVNDMDKYELTGRYKELMMIVMYPEMLTPVISMPTIPEDVRKEILNPPTDDDGYVHHFYLKDETKSLIELLTGKEE